MNSVYNGNKRTYLLQGDGGVDEAQALYELLAAHGLHHRLLVGVGGGHSTSSTPAFRLRLARFIFSTLKEAQGPAQAVRGHRLVELHQHGVRALHAYICASIRAATELQHAAYEYE